MGPFRRSVAALLAATVLAPASALAQQQENNGTSTTARGTKDSPEPLPVSLDRIRRQLATTKPRARSSNDRLKLEYYVEVYGRAPRIELFQPGENVLNTPVKYGGMTHQEFLQVVTPQEFKSPPADIGAAVAALVKWLSDKQKNGQTPKK